MQIESPELPVGMNGIHAHITRKALHRDEKGPYDHIWELVGYLPRRKTVVDHLVRKYFEELNPVHDCVHEDIFQASYDAFWNRKWGDDDLTAVDLRWLSLLFIMLAFAVLLNCPLDASTETQRDCEETSVQFFWASRKAIVMAPTFAGESPDLVRAGILVSRYLMYLGRKTESWLTSSFAIRMAQAQGMHIDGESWGFPAKVLESRRRLWCKLYALDRSISLAVGRPYTIHNKHCTEMHMRNVWVDDMGEDAAEAALERPINDPTPTLYYRYQQQLSAILGDIHDECFGLVPMTTSYSTYEKVLKLDKQLLSWAESLPAYFRLSNPDCSMDNERHYVYWQRMYLHSGYHFARMTLHRTYVLLESITDRFQYSRDACISSACADLKLKLGFRHRNMAERLKAGGAMHNLFNSALVLGIIAVRDPFSPRTGAILEDLAAYCEKQRADTWVNEFVLAEIKVIELCISTTRKLLHEGAGASEGRRHTESGSGTDLMANPLQQGAFSRAVGGWMPGEADSVSGTLLDASSAVGPCESWLDNWFGPTRSFPEPMDYQFWEDLVGTLEARQ